MFRCRTRALFLIVLAGAGTALAGPGDLWVVNQGTRDIDVIDTDSNRIVRTMSVLDPDGDGLPDTPWGVAFATAPGLAGGVAFISQQSLINVLDVATGNQLRPPWNLGSEPGLAGVELRGLAAARPRRLVDATGGEVLRSYLFAVANLPSGATRLLVLDQDVLASTAPAGSPIVARVMLDSAATGWEVHALDTASGGSYQRAWVTLAGGPPTAPVLSALLVAGGSEEGARWSVRDRRDVPLPPGAALPPTLVLGSPRGREAPVLPTAADGRLVNLQTGGHCTAVGHPSAVAIAGPGPGSYTVFAIDRQGEVLRILDPRNCSEFAPPVVVGAGPAALALLGVMRWQAVFVAARDGDLVTRVDQDGTVHPPIELAPPGPACSKCPISMAIVPRAACDVELVKLSVQDTVPDGVPDVVVEFDKVGCPVPDTLDVVVACQCIEDPLCACWCDCNPPMPGCFCPGVLGTGLTAPASFGPGDQLIGVIDPPTGENPWKELGRTVGSPFVHDDAGTGSGAWLYGVWTDQDPP